MSKNIKYLRIVTVVVVAGLLSLPALADPTAYAGPAMSRDGVPLSSADQTTIDISMNSLDGGYDYSSSVFDLATRSLTFGGVQRLYDPVGTAHYNSGFADGQTSADLEFTLETVNCLGACALGPVVVTDGTYARHMTASKVDRLLKRIKREEL